MFGTIGPVSGVASGKNFLFAAKRGSLSNISAKISFLACTRKGCPSLCSRLSLFPIAGSWEMYSLWRSTYLSLFIMADVRGFFLTVS